MHFAEAWKVGVTMREHNDVIKGIGLMLLSACLVTTGQFLWKLSADNPAYLFLGLVIYGLGALAMITAFRFGELSVLHPILSVSYVLSLVIGVVFLKEPATWTKILGIAAIFCGLVFLGLSAKKQENV